MPETGWLHYAGNPLAPLCRKRIGSYVPEDYTELARVKMERDILGKATAYFAKQRD